MFLHSFTFSVRDSVSTKAQSLTSSPTWRLWAFTVLPTTTLQTSVCPLHMYSYFCLTLLKTIWNLSNPVLSVCLSACASGSVIEVASGEYGDLNPVLFEAVQGGMCALEEKKNQCDNNGPSVCATRCPMVRSKWCAAALQSRLDYQLSKEGNCPGASDPCGFIT